MSLALTDKTIEKYFGFLSKLDINSKKKLIIKLTKSIEIKDDRKFDIKKLFGAWDDKRESDDIIKEIRDSRIESKNLSNL